MTESAPASARASALRAPSLGRRIALTVLLAFVVAAGIAGLWLRERFVDISAAETRDLVQSDLDLLASPVASALAHGDHDALRSMAERAGRQQAVRLTVILPDGTVVADSEHRLPLTSHADRPEVEAALRGGSGESERRSTTTGEAYRYAAMRLDGADGRPLGVLRLARPRSAETAIDREVLSAVVGAALIGLGVAGVVAWLAARGIARPLEDMTEAASRMAAGDFSRPPRAGGGDEAGRLADALTRMGTQISEMLRTRDEQRSELEAILGSMAEGLLAVDRDSRVVVANPAAAACLGLAEVPSAGTPLATVVRLPEFTAQLRRALAGEGAPETDVILPGAAGRVLGVAAAAMRAPDGTVTGAVLVLRDVTVVRRLERTRLDFVANVSHELRTPLAAMLGAIETIQDLADDERDARRQMLAMADRHGRRLTAIVDDLLALSQIESEGDRLERVPTPLVRSVRAAAATVAADAQARGVTIAVPGDDAPDARVLGHEGRLEQVWTNLIANAVKYNRPGGSVTVTVTADPSAGRAEVAVSDTGQGIAADQIPRIFERFYRVDKGRSRDQGGTGLGLAIVKHIVVAHRGEISVESVPGEGSTFRVRLPLVRPGPSG